MTAQNTLGVTMWRAMPTDLVTAQIEAVAGDIGADAVKIGMLASAAIVEAVAATIAELDLPHVVVDPVMVAKGGDRLLDEDAVAAMRTELLPRAHIVTPNVPEAEVLSGLTIRSIDDMRAAGERILKLGPRVVLVKGGHLRRARVHRRRRARRTGRSSCEDRGSPPGTRTAPAARCRRRSPPTSRSGWTTARRSPAPASTSRARFATPPASGGVTARSTISGGYTRAMAQGSGLRAQARASRLNARRF